jgi:two-component system, OmpR family, response regulator
MTVVAMPRRGHTDTALTVTFTVPLGGEALSPHAYRLLEVVRELVELGEGAVAVTPPLAVLPPPPVTGAALRVCPESRTVLRDGEPLELTRLEFDLLAFFAAHPRRVFTRLQLLGAVWGYEHGSARTVDVHVRRLRAKIGDEVPLVTTVYGVGYRLADDAAVTLTHDRGVPQVVRTTWGTP